MSISHRLSVPNKNCIFSLKIVFCLRNKCHPNETPHYAEFHLVLPCSHLGVTRIQSLKPRLHDESLFHET